MSRFRAAVVIVMTAVSAFVLVVWADSYRQRPVRASPPTPEQIARWGRSSSLFPRAVPPPGGSWKWFSPSDGLVSVCTSRGSFSLGVMRTLPSETRVARSDYGALGFGYREWAAPFATGYDPDRQRIVTSYCHHHELTFPLWAAVLATASIPCLSLRKAWQRRRWLRTGSCGRCGYNLTGNTSGVCPECGIPVQCVRSRQSAPSESVGPAMSDTTDAP